METVNSITKEDATTTACGPHQFKLKNNLMNKFFNEPVDALDLRLAKAEENLSTLPIDPFKDIKKEEGEETPVTDMLRDYPLDCSEVQLVSQPVPLYLDETIAQTTGKPIVASEDNIANEQVIPPLIPNKYVIPVVRDEEKEIQRWFILVD